MSSDNVEVWKGTETGVLRPKNTKRDYHTHTHQESVQPLSTLSTHYDSFHKKGYGYTPPMTRKKKGMGRVGLNEERKNLNLRGRDNFIELRELFT